MGSLITKRICFITTLPVTLKAFVRPQTEFLLQNGWDVTWICAEDTNFSKDIPNGVRYIPLKFKRGLDFFGIPGAIFALNNLFKNEHFDVVQYSTPNAAFYASTAARLAGVPIRIYAQWGIRYVGFDGIARFVFKLLERWCCACSTVVEPDSLSNLEFSIKENLYPRRKGRVIWNGSACGIDLVRFDRARKKSWRDAYRQKIGIESNHLVVGFVGSIRKDKGCNELIGACRSFFGDMPEARLLLIGDKNFFYTINKDLRDWVETSHQVVHISPNQEIPQYLSCMDVFSLPSYREGFGMVIIEAEAMGVPVVVSDVPGPIDAILPGKTGVAVPVKDTEALAAALKMLLGDKEKREAFGENAAKFVRENFEQQELLNRVLQDKERLLAEYQLYVEGKSEN